jgi:hypothetical protein
MIILSYIVLIWFAILLIVALYIEFTDHIEKKYYDRLKRDFENAWCDEQLLDIVYNTFKLKQKTK